MTRLDAHSEVFDIKCKKDSFYKDWWTKKKSYLTVVVTMCTRVAEVTSHGMTGRERSICVEGWWIFRFQFLSKTKSSFRNHQTESNFSVKEKSKLKQSETLNTTLMLISITWCDVNFATWARYLLPNTFYFAIYQN